MNLDIYKKMNPIIKHAGLLTEASVISLEPYDVRTVEYFEIDFVLNGTGSIISDGMNIAAKRNRMFIRWPGMVVQGLPPYYTYFFIIDLFAKDSNCYSALKSLPYFIDIKNSQRYIYTFESLFSYHYSPNEENFFQNKKLIYSLLEDVFNDCKTYTMSNTKRLQLKQVNEVKTYILSNLNKPLSLNELSSHVDLSPNFLSKIFHEHANETIVHYIQKAKIERAKKRLQESTEPINKIARKLGFENTNYFYKVFKEYVGKTPSSYRKNSINIYTKL